MNQAVKEFSDKLKELGYNEEQINSAIQERVETEIRGRIFDTTQKFGHDLELMETSEIISILKGDEQ